MLKLDRPSPTESELLFEIDPEPAREVLTAMGGAPLLVQAFRSLGLAGSVREHVHVKQRQRGYDEATFVESFVLRNGLGGECLDQKIATVDQDATIIESRKREALRAYEGERGYQPMLAVWAETNVILADEFRDGNVPAMMAPLKVAKAAFAALPQTVTTHYYRGDSACHESRLVNWLRNEKREDGPQGFIGFAISARMSDALHAAMLRVAPEAWQAYGKPH